MKQCIGCGCDYYPSGKNQKYCTKQCQYETYKTNGKAKMYRNTANAKAGSIVGVGSGGLVGYGEDNPNYKHGLYSFQNHAKSLQQSGALCERCGVELKSTGRYGYVGHHKDHNRSNNDFSNLEMLCKRCHQLHHDSGQYLRQYIEKVQRLSREGVGENIPEAPDNSDES